MGGSSAGYELRMTGMVVNSRTAGRDHGRRGATGLFALVALTALVAMAVLTGCGAGDPKPGPEVAGGVAAVDTPVNKDVKLADITLAYPADGVYHVGEDAGLHLAITNSGTTAVTLTDVTGPDFTDARSSAGSGDISIPVSPNDSVFIGGDGRPGITLVNLRKQLRSSQSIPVTFHFESAGSVTVQAMVAAAGQNSTRSSELPTPSPSSDKG